MMHPSGDFLSTPELDYEGWRDALRADWGRYDPEAIEPLPVERFPEACIGSWQWNLAAMLTVLSGHSGMFASMAWITTLLYFRLPTNTLVVVWCL
jgi:hypothetical protein